MLHACNPDRIKLTHEKKWDLPRLVLGAALKVRVQREEGGKKVKKKKDKIDRFPDPRHATGKSRSREKQEPKRTEIPFKYLTLVKFGTLLKMAVSGLLLLYHKFTNY